MTASDSKRQQAKSDKDMSVQDSSSAADVECEAESEMLPFHVFILYLTYTTPLEWEAQSWYPG